MPTPAKYTLIYNARTAAYVAVWNQDQPSSRPIPVAMKAARDAIGMLQEDLGDELLRAVVWDAIWTVANGDDWAAKCFCIVSNVSSNACADMANFNALEYLGCPGLLYAVARATAWRAIADTRTYETWNEAYELCLQQAQEIIETDASSD